MGKNKFMTLPTQVLDVLEKKEQLFITGGNSVISSTNNGTGKCSGTNNDSGRCSGVNNSDGLCGFTASTGSDIIKQG